MSLNQDCVQYCREINNKMLIQEVKSRPAIYNRGVKEYSDVVFKKGLWEEITAKMYRDVWDEMDETQKEARAAELLKRWNNLRTCFSRELKIMRDPLLNKRKKYIYFDKLLFLLDEIRPDLVTVKEPVGFPNSPSQDDEDHDQSAILTKALQKKPYVKPKVIRDLKKYVHNSIEKLREEIALKESREDSVESMPKTFDTDADTNFSLSIVPMLKMVPIDKKIDAQIEILNVLKKYTNRTNATFDYSIVKNERDDSEVDETSEELSYFGEEN